MITLSPEVRAAIGEAAFNRDIRAFDALTVHGKFLVVLNSKAQRTGTPVFAGIPAAEKAARRKRGKAQRAARRVARRA